MHITGHDNQYDDDNDDDDDDSNNNNENSKKHNNQHRTQYSDMTLHSDNREHCIYKH